MKLFFSGASRNSRANQDAKRLCCIPTRRVGTRSAAVSSGYGY
ncbi:Uncharacterized protein dnm_045080 [Desulfonema magnum]|uniref:Uncharacterized protein n=1 Tax=Desulfonema magnum TaxID=45655 RepID=A0A975BN02_9BACT|nr:Uncharacterized protein dnm_045080 [Desulfonema magnum]